MFHLVFEPGAESEGKREPASDIETVQADIPFAREVTIRVVVNGKPAVLDEHN